MSWTKDIPGEDAWYWIRYKGKHGRVVCPCRVTHLTKIDTVHVHTARNDSFTRSRGRPLDFDDAEFCPDPILQPPP